MKFAKHFGEFDFFSWLKIMNLLLLFTFLTLFVLMYIFLGSSEAFDQSNKDTLINVIFLFLDTYSRPVYSDYYNLLKKIPFDLPSKAYLTSTFDSLLELKNKNELLYEKIATIIL